MVTKTLQKLRRKKMTSIKSLNSFLVLGLVVAVALFLGVASPAFAAHENENPAALPASDWLDPDTGDVDPVAARIKALDRATEHTGDNKILVSGQPAGQTVSHYIVEGTDTPMWDDFGAPNGLYAGSQLASADGEPMEFFAPTSDTTEGPGVKVSNFFSWSETGGYELLSSVIASPSSSDTGL
jgi:hypothetical protein